MIVSERHDRPNSFGWLSCLCFGFSFFVNERSGVSKSFHWTFFFGENHLTPRLLSWENGENNICLKNPKDSTIRQTISPSEWEP